jgi:glycosyltransferase involved in cell wall biosynthesis
MNLPFISIIIPCRNEEKYIAGCLDSLIANDYAKEKIELFIIDGQSRDSTISIINSFRDRFQFIHLLDNPKKTFPAAVNIGVKASKGEFVFVAGAHAYYDRDYISKCVTNSIRYNADNTGGIMISKAQNESFSADIITSALSNPFGVGNSTFRTGSDKIIEADTVFGGCYKRDVFDRIGLFNENLISTSDYEFNKRLKRSGGKILLLPDIKVTYFVRSTFKSFLINNFRNGFWSIYPLAFVSYIPVSLRHFVPLVFLLSLSGSFILSFLFPFFSYLLVLILIMYFIVALFFSAKTLRLKMILFLPFYFFLLHLSYGLGSLVGLVKIFFLKVFCR